MEDFKEIITVEELIDMKFPNFVLLERKINEACKDLLSEEEKETLRRFEEVQAAPYAYSRNKYAFIPGREIEAYDREREIRLLEVKAAGIRSTLAARMPTNIYGTLQNIIKIRLSKIPSELR